MTYNFTGSTFRTLQSNLKMRSFPVILISIKYLCHLLSLQETRSQVQNRIELCHSRMTKTRQPWTLIMIAQCLKIQRLEIRVMHLARLSSIQAVSRNDAKSKITRKISISSCKISETRPISSKEYLLSTSLNHYKMIFVTSVISNLMKVMRWLTSEKLKTSRWKTILWPDWT